MFTLLVTYQDLSSVQAPPKGAPLRRFDSFVALFIYKWLLL